MPSPLLSSLCEGTAELAGNFFCPWDPTSFRGSADVVWPAVAEVAGMVGALVVVAELRPAKMLTFGLLNGVGVAMGRWNTDALLSKSVKASNCGIGVQVPEAFANGH